jgi:FdhD protein
MNDKPVAPYPALQWRRGLASGLERVLAEEAPIAIAYDGRPHAVLMASPADASDLAIGFTLSERIAAYGEIGAVSVRKEAEGLVADVALAATAIARLPDARGRRLESRTSCGLCGVDSLEEAVRAVPVLTGGPRLAHAALQAAFSALEAAQTLGRETRATHAAAWAEADGTLKLIREDVGRHNALDKLIGAAARAGLDPARAIILITSRCSYEMVEKTAAAGVAILAAISAPTALAVRTAEAANMTLIALARSDGHLVFTGAERIGDDTLSEAAE